MGKLRNCKMYKCWWKVVHYEEWMAKTENMAGCKSACYMEPRVKDVRRNRVKTEWMLNEYGPNLNVIIQAHNWGRWNCKTEGGKMWRKNGWVKKKGEEKQSHGWMMSERWSSSAFSEFAWMVCPSVLCITLDPEKEWLIDLNVCAVPMFILLVCFSRFRFFLCVWLWIFSFCSRSSFWC